MNQYYVDVRQVGNNLLIRQMDGNRPVNRKVKYQPTLYVPSESGSFTTLYGQPLSAKRFDSIYEAKNYIKKYEDVANFKIYGTTQFGYDWIMENHTDTINFDYTKLTILSLDIETASEDGFPNVQTANEEILLITVRNFHTKETITIGSRPYGGKHRELMDDPSKHTYIQADNERHLLELFMDGWTSEYPHVVTGWNSKFFDIPYLVHRINRLFGDEAAKQLSPWGIVEEKDVEINGSYERTYDIYGVNHIDYLDAYKKYGFTDKAPENYKLDTIGEAELGRKKLKNPYDTFKDFYTNDWDLFTCYNAVDVEIVDGLEEVKKLIFLMVSLAYTAKVNIADTFSPVRMWESTIRNYMFPQKTILPMNGSRLANTIEGAYVKEVPPRFEEWVVSFDAASLYPSIICQYNMSPETLSDVLLPGVVVDGMVEERYDLDFLKDQNLCMVANGHTFTREKRGLFPTIVDMTLKSRKEAKNKMLEAEKKFEETGDKQYKTIASVNEARSASYKVLANSLYGALSNQYFFLLDYRLAEGITLTGQYIIKTTQKSLNNYLNKTLGTTNVDYVIAIDTDSCYITLNPLVQKFFPNKSKEEIVDLIDKICKEKITPAINAGCQEIVRYTNAFDSRLEFKREVIADAALWTAKKRYAMNMYDKEGVRYKEPKLKIMGLEVVRSTTPALGRKYLKEAIKIILTGTQHDLHEFVENTEKEMLEMTTDQLALPKGCNNLAKYTSQSTIYEKGTPQHVKGALLYNHYVVKKGVQNKYPLIREGDKVRVIHLMKPNPLMAESFAYLTELPKEFDLDRFVDRESMIETVFLTPLQRLLDARGWTARMMYTFDDLF